MKVFIRPFRSSDFDLPAQSSDIRCGEAPPSLCWERYVEHAAITSWRAGAHGDPGQIRIRHRVDLKFLASRRHAHQRLGKRHRWFAIALLGFVKAYRIDSRHHIVGASKAT